MSVIENFEEWAHQRRQQHGHLGRHDQPHATTQESTMASRIDEAQAAIAHAAQTLAAIPPHPLAEALAESGDGATLSRDQAGLVIAMIRAIEHGPGTQQPAAVAAQPVQPQPIA